MIDFNQVECRRASPEREADYNIMRELLALYLWAYVPKGSRAAMWLHYGFGGPARTPQEVADILEIDVQAVHKRLSFGRDKLLETSKSPNEAREVVRRRWTRKITKEFRRPWEIFPNWG